MTKAEQFECSRIIKALACRPDDLQVAKMGQEFHAHLRDKYGRDYAMSVTDEMMSAVYRMRTNNQRLVFQPTGEVLEECR